MTATAIIHNNNNNTVETLIRTTKTTIIKVTTTITEVIPINIMVITKEVMVTMMNRECCS